MYRGKLWTMRQFAGFGTAEETNERFRYLLEHGQTGLSTAFDMPTLMGYDSDHPRSLGEVGREGVAIDSLDDMETLFAGIPLGEVSTSMTINAPARDAARLLRLRRRAAGRAADGAPRDDPDGHPQGVHRAEGVDLPARAVDAARHGHDRVLLARSMPLLAPDLDLRLPHPRGRLERRRRSSRSRSPTASRTSRRAIERGLDVDDFAPRLSFFFNAHLDFFEEIAKYRAARRIWARELRDRYGAKNPRSWLMRFHTQTAGVSLTAQQPEVNIVRTAIEALAAVLGGTQSLHTNSFDEALALPTEHAVRLALRTQQVIAHETGVVNTIDPLGGSYYVEHLTNELERQAYEYFDRIEQLGGVVAAIKENFFQREIAEASFRYQSRGRGEAARSSSASTSYVLEDEVEPELLRDRPGARGEADRARAGACGRAATRPRSSARSRALKAAAAEERREPDAADRRGLAGLRDDGRDVRRAPRGVGHLARDARLLAAPASSKICRRGSNSPAKIVVLPAENVQAVAQPSSTSRGLSRLLPWLAGAAPARRRGLVVLRRPQVRDRRATKATVLERAGRRTSGSQKTVKTVPPERVARSPAQLHPRPRSQRKNLDRGVEARRARRCRQGITLQGVAAPATSRSSRSRRRDQATRR